jgi:hypothetical protein
MVEINPSGLTTAKLYSFAQMGLYMPLILLLRRNLKSLIYALCFKIILITRKLAITRVTMFFLTATS